MLLIGYLLLALVVAAVLFYLVVALLPSGLMVTPIRDNRPMELPANRRLRVSDLDRIRIPVSLRGYRFAETDELIDRLAAEIQVRDEEIERLRQGVPPGWFGRPAEPEWAVRDLGDQAAAELAAEIGQPDVEQSDAEQPAAEQLAVEQPAAEQPDVEQPAAEQPDVEQPRGGDPDATERPEPERPPVPDPAKPAAAVRDDRDGR